MPRPPTGQNKLIQSLLRKTPLTVLDIETSGLSEDILSSGATHRGVILQVGGLQVPGMGSKETKKFQSMVDPTGQKIKIGKEWLEAYKVSSAFTELHGITTPFPGYVGKMESSKGIKEKLAALFPSSSKGLLIGHNIRKFDLPFIQERFGWSPMMSQQGQIIDLMDIAKEVMPGLSSYKLKDIAKSLRIKIPVGLHQSLVDSELTMEVFKKIAPRSAKLGEVLKRLHGVRSLEQVKFQEYWNKKNKEHWRSMEAGRIRDAQAGVRASNSFGDIDYRYAQSAKTISVMEAKIRGAKLLGKTSEVQQLDIVRSYYEDISSKHTSERLQAAKDYFSMRDIEESIFRGEHSPEVLNMARRRSEFWHQVDPRNVSKRFLVEQLGFTQVQADILKSGKYQRGYLKKLFSSRMGEFELTGHLPKTEFYGKMAAGGDSTRVVGFGEYSLEPGGFFSGMLPSGRSAYITPEQQRSFISNVFGRTRMYRFAGTGRMVTPEQMRKIKISAPQEALRSLEGMEDLQLFQNKIEKRLRVYRKLADLERKGKIKKLEAVDPYSYRAGTPTRRGKFLQTGEAGDLTLFEMMENDIQSSIDIMNKAEGEPLSEGGRAVEIHPGMTKEEMDRWASQATGMSPSAGQIEPSEVIGVPAGSEEVNPALSTSQESVSYVERERFYQKQYKDLKSKYERAFIFDYVETRGEGGKKRKERILRDYAPEIRERFESELSKLGGINVDLSKRTLEEAEDIIETALSKGATVYAREGKKLKEIESAPIENLGQVYLQDTAEKSSKLFSSLKNDIPVRAQAEQVFEAYFKRVKGKKAFGVYTAAGTYLGETRGLRGVPPVGAAKIFEWKGRYRVGWAPSDVVFRWNRYGGVEQALTEQGTKFTEISSLLDLDESFRLKYDADAQENLKRMYEQTGEDYKLISKYRFDRTMNSFVDVETGKAVDKATADTYMAKVEKTYRRHAAAYERLNRRKIRTSEIKSSKIGEAVQGLAGRIPKTKGMIFAALGLSSALVTLSAFSSRKQLNAPSDMSRANYGSTTDDERMFAGRPQNQPVARVVPEYSGSQGYSTNIDVYATDSNGVDHRDLADIMDRHARRALGSTRGSTSIEINDNSDKSTQYDLQRKYYNMMRA